jgi:hypothetical protein
MKKGVARSAKTTYYALATCVQALMPISFNWSFHENFADTCWFDGLFVLHGVCENDCCGR